MPHINMKHFSALTEQQQLALTNAFTQAVVEIAKCDEGAISIALEPIAKEVWNAQVYVPEIIKRKELLVKTPNY